MRKQIIVLGESWGDYDEYNYHMISFIESFKKDNNGCFRGLHKWLFE